MQMRYRFFRYDEHMAVALRADIKKGVDVVVLVNLEARDFTADDLVE